MNHLTRDGIEVRCVSCNRPHDTNSVAMGLTAAVTVSVPITHPRLLGVGSGSVASSSELFTVVRPSI